MTSGVYKRTERHRNAISKSRPNKLKLSESSRKSKSNKMKDYWKKNKKGNFIQCKYCLKNMYVPPCLIEKKVYCDKECYRLDQIGKKQSQEQIMKRSEKLKIPCSEDKKRKISKKLIGHEVSDETKLKISKSKFIDGRSFIYSGKALYGDNWNEIRKQVYKRDNYACKDCGKKMTNKAFDVHHKIPFLVSFDNSLDNLVTLCRKCHMKSEQELKRKYKLDIKETREKLKEWLLDNNIFSKILIAFKDYPDENINLPPKKRKKMEIQYKEFENE